MSAPLFVARKSFDFNGYLGLTAKGEVWYVSDVSCYEVSAHLWGTEVARG